VERTDEQAFLSRWEQRRDWLAGLGASVNAVALIDAIMSELRALWQQHDDQHLTLAQASAESGYSVDHLGRLVREGRLANVGRRRAPRVRRCDLPKKVRGNFAAVPELPYDIGADARFLRKVRRGE
jgi:hypothetical protein